MEMNKILGRDVLLSYPYFSEDFIINADAIKNADHRNNYSKWESQ